MLSLSTKPSSSMKLKSVKETIKGIKAVRKTWDFLGYWVGYFPEVL